MKKKAAEIGEVENQCLLGQSNDGLSTEYKAMIDAMLEEENNGTAEYVSFQYIKEKFSR